MPEFVLLSSTFGCIVKNFESIKISNLGSSFYWESVKAALSTMQLDIQMRKCFEGHFPIDVVVTLLYYLTVLSSLLLGVSEEVLFTGQFLSNVPQFIMVLNTYLCTD